MSLRSRIILRSAGCALVACLFAIACALCSPQAGFTISGGQQENPEYSSDSIIVVFKSDAPTKYSAQSLGINGAYCYETIAESSEGDIVKVALPESVSVDEALETFTSNENVAYAQPNYRYRLVGGIEATSRNAATSSLDRAEEAVGITVNDPYANLLKDSGSTVNEWYLENANVPAAWTDTTVDGDVTVAIMDTGINFEHEDLAKIIDRKHARQFTYDDEDNVVSTPYTESEEDTEYLHGSHVAGIVALLWAKDPSLTVEEVQDILYSTAADLGSEGRDDYYGYGKVDAAAALAAIASVHIAAEDRPYTGKPIVDNVNVIDDAGTYLI